MISSTNHKKTTNFERIILKNDFYSLLNIRLSINKHFATRIEIF